jgi:ABC-2 type transport system ATP-binding protein
MLGLALADAGRAQVLGLDSRREGLAIRRRVGYVPERPTLYEWMTVAEIGWFVAGLYDDQYLAEYLRLVGHYELPETRKIAALSKGMRAKVSLALALAGRPQLLVLDEPTSGLDTLVRREFLESMVDLAAEGRTVLLSSHQIGEVERVADIVAILKEGRLLVLERLDALRAQIQEVTLTLHDAGQAPPELRGEVLRERRRGRQWQLLVRHASDAQFQTLRDQPAVESVELRSPNLEEIFVAYMQPSGRAVRPDVGREALVSL